MNVLFDFFRYKSKNHLVTFRCGTFFNFSDYNSRFMKKTSHVDLVLPSLVKIKGVNTGVFNLLMDCISLFKLL